MRAPYGPMALGRQLSSSTSALDMVGRPPARLHTLVAQRRTEKPTYDTYSHKWCLPSYYDRGR